MNSPTLALIDDGGRGLLPAGDITVALTPSAWHRCRVAGRETFVTDDLVDRQVTLPTRVAHAKWKLEWLERLDWLLNADGAAVTSALSLAAPLDSIIVEGRLLQGLFDAILPARVCYSGQGTLRRQAPRSKVRHGPILERCSLAAQIIRAICAERRIPVEWALAESPKPRPSGEMAWDSKLMAITASRVRLLQVLGRPSTNSRASLLLWSVGYGSLAVANGERVLGRRVLTLQRRRGRISIFEASYGGPRLLSTIADGGLAVRGPARLATSRLDTSIAEVAGRAGLPRGGEIVRARIETFANELVPAVRLAAAQLAISMRECGVERVLCANPCSVEEYAALLAARRAGIQRILVQHGDRAFRYTDTLIGEAHNADEIWTSDLTTAEEFRILGQAIGSPIPIVRVWAPRLQRARKMKSLSVAGPVCYVPSFLTGESAVIGADYFDDAWYHRWQLRLLDWMGNHENVQFIWKALPASNQGTDPIPAVIRRMRVTNVAYRTGRLLRAYRGSSCVITDFLSTAFYEAIHARRPVLGLAFRRFTEIRPAVVALCGPSVVLCDDEWEAIVALTNFIEQKALGRFVVRAEKILPECGAEESGRHG